MEEYEVYRPKKPKGFYLDPRTKILFMIFITTIMSVGYKDILISLISAIVAIALLLSNKQVKIALIYGGLFALAIIAHFTKDMYILPIFINTVSVLLNALILRLFPIFMLGYYIVMSTKTSEFIASMVKWKIPNVFIIPTAVAFRFIPTLHEEHSSIKTAMKMRGISFRNKRAWKKPSLYLEYVTIPLIVSIAKIGDELSAAAISRGLGGLRKRTSVVKVKFTIYDVFILCISTALIGLFLYRRG
ncbi:MAG: energy-coupling factor transporter transmembrane component T [Filifactoraceae bacterium]